MQVLYVVHPPEPWLVKAAVCVEWSGSSELTTHSPYHQHTGAPQLHVRAFDEEHQGAAMRLQTPIGAAVTTRLAQKMLADFCGKLPGCDRCVRVVRACF